MDFPPVVLLEDFQEIQAFLIVAAVGAQSSRTSSWTRASLAREAAIEARDTRKWGRNDRGARLGGRKAQANQVLPVPVRPVISMTILFRVQSSALGEQ